SSFFFIIRPPPSSTLFPYTMLFRSPSSLQVHRLSKQLLGKKSVLRNLVVLKCTPPSQVWQTILQKTTKMPSQYAGASLNICLVKPNTRLTGLKQRVPKVSAKISTHLFLLREKAGPMSGRLST